MLSNASSIEFIEVKDHFIERSEVQLF